MSDAVEDAKREEIIAGMSETMRTLTDDVIASRTVGMLIMAEGNLNKYQATLEIVLAAHSRARGNGERSP